MKTIITKLPLSIIALVVIILALSYALILCVCVALIAYLFGDLPWMDMFASGPILGLYFISTIGFICGNCADIAKYLEKNKVDIELAAIKPASGTVAIPDKGADAMVNLQIDNLKVHIRNLQQEIALLKGINASAEMRARMSFVDEQMAKEVEIMENRSKREAEADIWPSNQ